MYDDELTKAKQADEQRIRIEFSRDRVARLRALHDSMTEQLRNCKLADEARRNGQGRLKIEQLEAPDENIRKIWPSPKLVLASFGMIGLMVGSAAGILRSHKPT